MPFWCIQDNECLACTGGCEGYETKREAMRERRASFWKIMDEMEEEKETAMVDHICQAAKNTDICLYSEPNDKSEWPGANGWQNKMCLTPYGGISINISGHVITKTLKQWHTLAAEDFKRQEETATNAQRALDTLDAWMGEPVKPLTFAQKLAALLNENNKEKGSNTPDFVLAEYMTNCLGNFEAAMKAREKFYGVASRPGSGVIGTVDYKGCTVTRMDDEHTHAIEMNARQASNASLLAL